MPFCGTVGLGALVVERAGSEFGYQVAKIIERQMDDNERRKTGAGSKQWQ